MKRIPKGAVAATITGNQKHMGNLSTKVMEMLAWVNDYDGFNISGWIKCGTIADSGVVQQLGTNGINLSRLTPEV